jgi:hypothetical protein
MYSGDIMYISLVVVRFSTLTCFTFCFEQCNGTEYINNAPILTYIHTIKFLLVLYCSIQTRSSNKVQPATGLEIEEF